MDDDDGPSGKRAYEVGYRKPPRATRFVKGRSGNPAGRPKKGKSFAELLEAEFNDPVFLTENGKRKKISTRHAVVKQLKSRALTGDAKARDQLIKLMAAHDAKGVGSAPSPSPPAAHVIARGRFLLTLAPGLIERGILKKAATGFILDPSMFKEELRDVVEALNGELKQFDVFF